MKVLTAILALYLSLETIGLGAPPIILEEGVSSRQISHKKAYNVRTDLGNYLDVKVTPPSEPTGKPGLVLIEVYNRGKKRIEFVQFDVTLENRKGLRIEAPVEASDLNPNMSGEKWIRVPTANEKFPSIDKAIVKRLRVMGEQGKELKLRLNVDLIKN